MENKSLYPRLLNHSNKEIAEIAKTFIKEMGGIGEAVNEYKKTWPQENAIMESPESFIKQTNSLFNVLGKRIEKENTILYKKVDDL